MFGQIGMIRMASWPSLIKSACSCDSQVGLSVGRLKEHEINEKAGTDHYSFHSHIQIHRKLDSEVVRIRKRFPKKS